MILPQELRIGNKVREEVLGIVPVSEISFTSAWVEAMCLETDKSISIQRYHISLDQLFPIPITHDILKMFGFAKQNTKSAGGFTIYCISGMELLVDDSENPFSNIQVSYERMFGLTVYLGHRRDLKTHQLQNLYYSLTGKELEVNL